MDKILSNQRLKILATTPKGVLIVSIIFLLSCNKILNRECWDCEVRRMDGTTYNDKWCSDDGTPPQYTDANGNDLNSVCTKR